MDEATRAGFNYTGDVREQKKAKLPFELSIRNLIKIEELESPMVKLEHIYKCCTSDIQKSLDEFWRNYDIPNKKLSVDVDNLQSIIVYMISRLKDCPQIITNLYIIEDFLPEAVQLSNRAFYLAMMQSSCEFLLNLHKKADSEFGLGSDSKNKSRDNIE